MILTKETYPKCPLCGDEDIRVRVNDCTQDDDHEDHKDYQCHSCGERIGADCWYDDTENYSVRERKRSMELQALYKKSLSIKGKKTLPKEPKDPSFENEAFLDVKKYVGHLKMEMEAQGAGARLKMLQDMENKLEDWTVLTVPAALSVPVGELMTIMFAYEAGEQRDEALEELMDSHKLDHEGVQILTELVTELVRRLRGL